MSKILINQYYNNLDRAIQFGKSINEQSIRNHFWSLLNDYARKQNYEVVPEVSCMGTKGKKVYPDGIVKNLFGLDIGLWESKDEKDSIEDEIDAKQKKGYPLSNILFEDTQTAILFQHGEEVMRVPVRDADKLHSILTKFVSFKSEPVYKFEDALEKFKADIPIIVDTLRKRIDETRVNNKNFIAASNKFFELCKAEINPDITEADVREMMIQHILTSDIFNKIFDDPTFHRHNNIAFELEKLIDLLFTYNERKNLMGNIEHYYDAINSAAAGIPDHHEKQKFLKVLYEQFYKVYNPKAADRLGVIYTPNEIVQFMIESTDYLLDKYFGKTLADKKVEILDPATGTGTFITTIIDRIPPQHLAYKYKNEINANEVAILPYYVANLNVEYTFKQKMGYYEEFKNICFVDTLDNIDALSYRGQQRHFLGLTSENTERIKRQNSKIISVIIGNPPYNANQKNENENNKNREYPAIDKRIKNTYIKYSNAQKTKAYDMYARFYRWATDRLANNGILAFITNRSFIDSRTFDGFRKCIQNDFTASYIIDTKSDVRANPKIAGTTHNVFGIQTGVAIMFLVKKVKQQNECIINYTSLEDDLRKEEKLDWLRTTKFENISFEKITPDKNNNWLNLVDNDFDRLLPLIDRRVKSGKTKDAILKIYSTGISTNRDDWIIDFSKNALSKKMNFFAEYYSAFKKEKDPDTIIKWSRNLKQRFERGLKENFSNKRILKFNYRPYVHKFIYYSDIFIDEHGLTFDIFSEENLAFCISGRGATKPFQILAANTFSSLDFLEKTQIVPLYYYPEKGVRIENITDWGLIQFQTHYKDKSIKKEDIFYYAYAVLHNPFYRRKYELNLRREFPRLPFYNDFWKWLKWGKELMDLHMNYEKAEPYNLKLLNQSQIKPKTPKQAKMFANRTEPESLLAHKPKTKIKLRVNKEAGIINLDEETSLSGVPKEAWEYKLGNRSALEWILDQYKEKKPKDPTIEEKFNTYRFADYKDQVIDLLKRVCTVSVETMKIVKEMRENTTVANIEKDEKHT